MEGGRLPRATGLLIALLALLPAACRLACREGPVPRSLATCRELSRQGIAALERGQPQQAETLLEEAVETCPVDPDARRHYAEALWLRGAQSEAVAQLEEAANLAPDDALLRVRLAEMHLAMGQLDRAGAIADQAVDLDPKLAEAWAVRGRVMLAAGDTRRALADFHRALSYAPEDRDVLLETAELHRRMGRPQRALATLQSLADTYSPGEEPQRVLHLTGLAYMALGQYEDAVTTLSDAAVRQTPSPDLLWHLGEAELRAGRPEAAAAAARHALSLQPQHQASRTLLARIEATHAGHTPLRR